jgi:hypothetical protein
MRSLVLIDIDHTVSDAAWRDCLMPLDHARGDWSTYYSCQDLDGPLPETIEFVQELARESEVMVVTGRDESHRQETQRWLTRHGVPCTHLLMRPPGNKMPSPELKMMLARNLLPRVTLVIDDREDVRAAFQAAGIKTMCPTECRGP